MEFASPPSRQFALASTLTHTAFEVALIAPSFTLNIVVSFSVTCHVVTLVLAVVLCPSKRTAFAFSTWQVIQIVAITADTWLKKFLVFTTFIITLAVRTLFRLKRMVMWLSEDTLLRTPQSTLFPIRLCTPINAASIQVPPKSS